MNENLQNGIHIVHAIVFTLPSSENAHTQTLHDRCHLSKESKDPQRLNMNTSAYRHYYGYLTVQSCNSNSCSNIKVELNLMCD